MKPLAVADSACLIGLERIGKLDLISAQFTTVLAPPAVIAELGVPLSWLRLEALRRAGESEVNRFMKHRDAEPASGI